jgi:chitinase
MYDGVQWVSWMFRGLYDERVNWIDGLDLGGTSDWAIDLDAGCDVGDGPAGGDNGSGPVLISPDIYNEVDPVAACYPPWTFVLQTWLLSTATTITMPRVTVTFEKNWVTNVMIDDSVIIITSATRITIPLSQFPPVTTTAIDVWNVAPIDEDDDNDDTIWLASSVAIPRSASRRRSHRLLQAHPSHQRIGPDLALLQTQGKTQMTMSRYRHRHRRHLRSPPACRVRSVVKPCLINCKPRENGCFDISGCVGPICPAGSCVGRGCGGGGGGGGGGIGDLTTSEPAPPPHSARLTALFSSIPRRLRRCAGT